MGSKGNGSRGCFPAGFGTYLATACAQKNAPVVLTSSVRFHSSGVISTACWQPTTPAKHIKISTLPSSCAARSTAVWTCVASVTLTLSVTIVACGKSVRRASISALACDGSRSNRARPERPCSSSARALTKARVPAPPVTGD